MPWTSADLVASVKRRAGAPSASATFSTAEILTVADEETQSYIVPLVLKTREDYWLAHHEEPIVSGVYEYPIPSRAVAGKLREIVVLGAYREAINLPRVSLTDLEESGFGFHLQGDRVVLVTSGVDPETWGTALRMSYSRRPSALVETSAAAVITDVAADTVTVSSVPAALAAASSFDVVKAKPGFEVLGADAAGTFADTVLTFEHGTPENVVAGDYVCLPEQTPVPQVPAELHPLLAQRVAVAILLAKNMTDKATQAAQLLKEMEAAALGMITPRVDGEAKVLVHRTSLFRTGW